MSIGYSIQTMRILYILKHNPWGIGGGCYACKNYLEAFITSLPEAEFEICVNDEYLYSMHRDAIAPRVHFLPVPARSLLCKVGAPITGILHRYQKVALEQIRNRHYDYCIFDHNSIAGSLVKACHNAGIRTIVIHHNCEADYFRDNTPFLMKRMLLLTQVKRCERNAFLNCDYNIFLTEEDLHTFEQLYGKAHGKNIVGGCFYPKNGKRDSTLQPFHKDHIFIAITGTMGNVQNLDGLNYFVDQLYPLLPQKGVDIIMAGKNPPADFVSKVRSYPNIEIIANPKDMDEILSKCDLYICPTRLGGGMKLRVMDGLRNGLPVIAHKVSGRGYQPFARQGYLYAYETSEEFAMVYTQLVAKIKDKRITKMQIKEEANDVFDFFKASSKIFSNIFD